MFGPAEGDCGEEGPQCRICWAPDEADNLLSPCKCKGTQQHIHLKCLRMWQENVQKRDASDERAFRCSVCRVLFSVPPPKGREGLPLKLLRGVGTVVCVALLVLGLSGPPFPLLALLVLLLLGTRSGSWLPGIGLLAVATLLATLHARGLRVVMRMDGGGRLGLALIRYGAPVQGLQPGVLLVASEGLHHSVFRRSVVLLTAHGRNGARGLILTQPIHAQPPTLPASAGVAAGGDAAAGSGEVPLRHHLGGPVGMPGEGVHTELSVLHPFPEFGRRLVPAPEEPRQRSAAVATAAAAVAPRANATGEGSSREASTPSVPLYEGGSLADVLAAAAGQRRRARAGQEGPPVLLFHGVCAWAEGQLEGELRAGAWAGFVQPRDIWSTFAAPPDELWRALANSPELMRAD